MRGAFHVLLFLYYNFMKTECFHSKWILAYNSDPVMILKNIDFWKFIIITKSIFRNMILLCDCIPIYKNVLQWDIVHLLNTSQYMYISLLFFNLPNLQPFLVKQTIYVFTQKIYIKIVRLENGFICGFEHSTPHLYEIQLYSLW